MTDAQGWTLLGLVGVLLSVLGALLVNQFHLLRVYLDARFAGIETRFEALGQRMDHLDRDVQALIRDRFDRGES